MLTFPRLSHHTLQKEFSILSCSTFSSFISQISSTRLGYCTFAPAVDFFRFTRSILLCSPFSCRISGNLVIPSSACVRSFPCLLLQSTHPKFTLSFHPSFHTGDEGDLLNIFSVKRFRGFCRRKKGRFRIFGNYNTSLCVVST